MKLIKLWQIFSWLTRIYMELSTILFFVFGRGLAIQLEDLQKQVRNVSPLANDVGNSLQKWSIRHSLICRSAMKLEQYFSMTLLLSISCIFIQIITYCHSFFRHFSRKETIAVTDCIFYAFHILRMLLLIQTICQVADRMRIEVY